VILRAAHRKRNEAMSTDEGRSYISGEIARKKIRAQMLDNLIRTSNERYEKLSPEQKAQHDKEQRESFVRGQRKTGDPRFD
jgi:hypothetical protein